MTAWSPERLAAGMKILAVGIDQLKPGSHRTVAMMVLTMLASVATGCFISTNEWPHVLEGNFEEKDDVHG